MISLGWYDARPIRIYFAEEAVKCGRIRGDCQVVVDISLLLGES